MAEHKNVLFTIDYDKLGSIIFDRRMTGSALNVDRLTRHEMMFLTAMIRCPYNAVKNTEAMSLNEAASLLGEDADTMNLARWASNFTEW
jgi:hypothetical protein